MLYVLNNGVMTSYTGRTGEQVYQKSLGGTGGAFSASPVAADGKIYCASEDGDVYVIKAGPEYEELAKNSIGEVVMATPAISDGLIIFRGLKHVYAIKAGG
jgi:outer membrane protein assembly factor BamB